MLTKVGRLASTLFHRWWGLLLFQLPRRSTSVDTFSGPVPHRVKIGWHLVLIRARRQTPGWTATLHFAPPDGIGISQAVTLVRPFRRSMLGIKLGVFFLNGGTSKCIVRLYCTSKPPGFVSLVLLPLPQLLAAVGVWVQNPNAFWIALQAVSGPPLERIRKAISLAAIYGQRTPKSYPSWLQLFDSWSEEHLDLIINSLCYAPSVSAVVFHAGNGNVAALEATLASLQDQKYPFSQILVIEGGSAAPSSQSGILGEWIAVIQAGETLPRHALLLLVERLGQPDRPELLLADEDRILPDGTRADPLFKPQPSLTLVCSGLLSRGVWLMRSEALHLDTPWAECVRLEGWFSLHAAGRAKKARRVPFLLTHRRDDVENAPPTILAEIINARIRHIGLHAEVTPSFPLRLQWDDGKLERRLVSILVPSRLRGTVQLGCLLDVLAKTTYAKFEMLVVITQKDDLDEGQLQAAQRLLSDSRVRIEILRQPSFNYSLANNFAASMTTGDFICLLNDDVSPLDGKWLDRMVAMFSDGDTGIVGAKLYYPNMTTQHGGVIMGLAGLAEHVNRFLPRGEPGYAWRGVLDQEFSCVTGACLLVRRGLYERLGGLDESLPTGFNDVDFCLRVGKLGYSIVFAAHVEMIHHETISFGHHYSSNREQEAADVKVMRERWPDVCEDDPFHNPNLSLTGQTAWELAYPPRNFDKRFN